MLLIEITLIRAMKRGEGKISEIPLKGKKTEGGDAKPIKNEETKIPQLEKKSEVPK